MTKIDGGEAVLVGEAVPSHGSYGPVREAVQAVPPRRGIGVAAVQAVQIGAGLAAAAILAAAAQEGTGKNDDEATFSAFYR